MYGLDSRRGRDGQCYTESQYLDFYEDDDQAFWNWLAAGAAYDAEYSWATGDDPNAPTEPWLWYALKERRKALDRCWYTYAEFIEHYGVHHGNINWYAAGRFWFERAGDIGNRSVFASRPPVAWAFIKYCKVCGIDFTRNRVSIRNCRMCKHDVCIGCSDVDLDIPISNYIICTPCIYWANDN